MASATRGKNVFRRPAPWYRIVAISCFCFGGWVLMANIELTILGLVAEGWPREFIDPLAWGIAAIEAAVSIFLTQPENWGDLWDGLEDVATGRDESTLPGWLGLALAATFLTVVLAMTAGAYAFDFFSTHSGLYGLEVGITWKSALFTLGYNWGTELLCFFGWQSWRMARIASRDNLTERMEVEPEIIWREQLLQHRTAMAKEMAQDQIQAEKASYRSGKSCNGKGRKN
jgi:hypothetical protein